MKNILLIPVLLSLLIVPMIVPTIGLAAAVCPNEICEAGETPVSCPEDCGAPSLDVMVVLNNVINWLFYILLIVAVIFIIIAAYYFVTASGNPETVAKARNLVMYALIGILVAFLARGLVWLIQKVAVTS